MLGPMGRKADVGIVFGLFVERRCSPHARLALGAGSIVAAV